MILLHGHRVLKYCKEYLPIKFDFTELYFFAFWINVTHRVFKKPNSVTFIQLVTSFTPTLWNDKLKTLLLITQNIYHWEKFSIGLHTHIFWLSCKIWRKWLIPVLPNSVWFENSTFICPAGDGYKVCKEQSLNDWYWLWVKMAKLQVLLVSTKVYYLLLNAFAFFVVNTAIHSNEAG